MQLRRANQKSKKTKNKNIVEYEIKNYGGNASRGRSPDYQKNKRSPKHDESNSPRGEMDYIDPNDIENVSKNYLIRSPIGYDGIKEKTVKTKDTEDRSALNNKKKKEYGQYQKSVIDSRREKLRRSPKTINLGETAEEVEYNMKSINRPRKSKKEKDTNINDKDKDASVIERTYNMISNEAGNIFLDQPIQKSFINQQEVLDGKGSFDSKDIKDIQYSMNPRDFHEANSGIFGKMSHRGNIEPEYSDSNSEKNDDINNTQIKNLRTQLEKRRNSKTKNEDGMVISKTKQISIISMLCLNLI